MKTNLLSVSSIAMIAAALSPTAIAQDTAETEDSQLRVETVTVTADRRAEDAQSVAIAVTAFDEESLELRNIAKVEDLQASTPGLYFFEENGRSYINVRGVGGEPNSSVLADPSVTFNIDGVAIARPKGLEGAFFDLERVEVLRGPQGTLYGRNATGGAIGIVSNAPKLGEVEGSFDVAAGNFNFREARGVLNVPLGDKAAIRVAGIDRDREGYIENVFDPGTDDDQQDEDSSYIRTQLRVEPADETAITLGFVYGDRRGRGTAQSQLRERQFDPRQPLLALGLQPALPTPTEPRTVRLDEKQLLDDEDYTGSFTLEQGLSFADLTVIGAYVRTESYSIVDGDRTELDFVFVDGTTDTEQLSGEIRLASNGGQPFSWIVGASFLEEDNIADSFFRNKFTRDIIVGLLQSFPSPPGTPPLDVSLLPPIVNQTNSIISEGEASSYAVFGDATVPVTERFSVTGGLRYTFDEKTLNNTITSAFDVPILPGSGAPTTTMRSDDYSALTGRLIGEFQMNEDQLLYASLSRGYKAGGFSVDLNATPYDPEFLTALEIGSKNTLLNGRLILNGAAFYYDHTDLQVQTARNVGTQSVLFIENSDATVYGAELEAVYVVSPSITIDGSLSLLDATYDGFISADPTGTVVPSPQDPMALITEEQDLDGAQRVFSPNYSGTVGVQFLAPLSNGGVILTRADVAFSDDVVLRPYQKDEIDTQDAYATINANLTWRSPSEAYSVEVFGRNLTDEDVQSSTQSVNQDNPVTWQAPRTFGVRLGFAF